MYDSVAHQKRRAVLNAERFCDAGRARDSADYFYGFTELQAVGVGQITDARQ